MSTETSDVIDEFLGLAEKHLPRSAQRRNLAHYLTGLLSSLERKSVEPIAAMISPLDVKRTQGALLHFVAYGAWQDAPLRTEATQFALRSAAPCDTDVLGTVVDDTGMLKQGKHSVGVKRQYTGSAGKVANCQIAVTLAVYTARETLPLDIQLYLPVEWIEDSKRRELVGIPQAQTFETKPQMALRMLKEARARGIPLGKYLAADAGYGYSSAFRNGVTKLGLKYGVGVQSTQQVWDAAGVFERAMTVREVADMMLERDFRRCHWRDGRDGKRLSSRFATMRVQVTRKGAEPTKRTRRQWLVMEWRDGEEGVAHFYLCTYSSKWSKKKVVRVLMERWRIERMHEDLKGEVGFDHYEGRSWVGWNHHVTAAMCAFALLVTERCKAFPPSAAAGPNHVALGLAS